MEYFIKLSKYSKRLYNWSRKPWPLHIFPFLVIIHLLFLQFLPESHQKINDYFSACFQILGGLIVLHSINSNMRFLSKSNIIKEVYAWIKSFPLRSRNVTISISDSISATSSLSANLVVVPKLSNIEEKVEHLLEEIKRIDSKIEDTKKDFREEIQRHTEKSNKKMSKLHNRTHEIEMNLKRTVVGSVKLEVLGVFTISYGIFIPIIY
jgi:hypothetical protein